MPSAKHIKIFQLLENIVLILLLIAVLGLAILSAYGKLGVNESYAGGGIVILMLLVLLFIQHKVNSWVTVVLSQSNFVRDDAFTSLYDSSPVAYLTVKFDGTIIKGNPAATNLLQAESESIVGQNLFKLLQADENSDPLILQSKLTSGLTVVDEEMPLLTMSGDTVWVMLSTHTDQVEGQSLVSLVDITDQKNIDMAKSEFVALATHQLRTPIATIRWNTELLDNNMKDTKTPDQARYLSTIERNVFRMIDLINDFLSVSKLEMGTFATNRENVGLKDFFTTVINEFSEQITTKHIKLERLDSPSAAVIKIDKRLLHIIISNLVSNAVKYSTADGVLQISYQLKGDALEVVVADNGIGIPTAEIPKLFTKFFRASNAQSHQAEGTGLGLYVVKQAVTLLKGTVQAKSAPEQGTRFIVNLPVQVVSVRDIG